MDPEISNTMWPLILFFSVVAQVFFFFFFFFTLNSSGNYLLLYFSLFLSPLKKGTLSPNIFVSFDFSWNYILIYRFRKLDFYRSNGITLSRVVTVEGCDVVLTYCDRVFF